MCGYQTVDLAANWDMYLAVADHMLPTCVVKTWGDGHEKICPFLSVTKQTAGWAGGVGGGVGGEHPFLS